MSGLQNFLAPFSHLLFQNRNIVIVLLCAVAFWAAIQALLDRWRADRLERDLHAARSNASIAPLGRRHATSQAMEDVAESGGPLPPIKAGRSYARNLGSALQKAGMSGPQIYSPPTPAGFSPNTNPMPQQATTQPYGQPPIPWAAPGGPPASPWGFPGGGARNVPPQGPNPAPFYQPPPAAPHLQPSGAPPAQLPQIQAQPAGPPANAPSIYAPAGPPPGFPAPQQPPFAAPSFPVPTSGPTSAPSFSPPAGPGPMGPAAPGPAQPGPEADHTDANRRGKPKRRRFNFNVLENLEKMVQTRPAEPAPTTGWTPPPTPAPAAPAAPVTPVSASGTTPAPLLTPPAADATVVPKPAEEAPTLSLPFSFGKRKDAPVATPPVEASSPVAAEAEVEESQPDAAEPQSDDGGTEPVVEAKREPSQSMRSMMFGEERAAAQRAEQQQPAAQPQPSDAPELAASADAEETEPNWSQPWSQREEASSSAETEVPADQANTSDVPEEPQAVASSAFEPYDPWKPASTEPAADSWASDREGSKESEPVTAEDEPWRTDAEDTSWKPVTEPEGEPGVSEEPAAEPVAAAGEADSAERSEPATADGSESPSSVDGDNGGAGTLVIIEDDQTAASYYATLFKGNGYRVEVANDGVSGVDLCARVQPQVILLDVMMPRQNGILVLQTLRASDETKNTPVVVMSNFSEPTLIKRALQLGALEYVIKTQVEGPALLSALPRWMNREKAFAAA